MTVKDPPAAPAALIECLPIAVAVFDGAARLVSANAAYGDLWKLDPAWLEGGPTFGEILDRLRAARTLPEQVDFAAYRAAQLARFGSLRETLDELLHLPDGGTVRALSSPGPGGGLVIAYEDVSARLDMERRVNQARAVLGATIDGLGEGLGVFGGDGILILANPAFRALWGIAEEETGGSLHLAGLLDRQARLMENPEEFTAGIEALRGRLLGRERGGGRWRLAGGRLLEMSHAPLPDGALLLAFRDSSDSERTAQALAERAREMEATLAMKARFLANLSHELRTPLTTVSGFAEILTGGYFGALNPRQQDYAQGIHQAAEQLTGLISDIMDLANMEAGLVQLETDSFDLHLCLAGLLGLVRERVRERKLALEFDCPPDIGWIIADQVRIRQAVLHLLANAIAFTQPGGTVKLSARRRGTGLTISVADSGVGMPRAELARIRQGLQRGTEVGLENPAEGAGLGLLLVARFMALHGGSMDIASRSKRGTTVTLNLPAD